MRMPVVSPTFVIDVKIPDGLKNSCPDRSPASAVNIPAMPNLDHEHDKNGFLNLVDHPVIAHAYSEEFLVALELETTRRTGGRLPACRVPRQFVFSSPRLASAQGIS